MVIKGDLRSIFGVDKNEFRLRLGKWNVTPLAVDKWEGTGPVTSKRTEFHTKIL